MSVIFDKIKYTIQNNKGVVVNLVGLCVSMLTSFLTFKVFDKFNMGQFQKVNLYANLLIIIAMFGINQVYIAIFYDEKRKADKIKYMKVMDKVVFILFFIVFGTYSFSLYFWDSLTNKENIIVLFTLGINLIIITFYRSKFIIVEAIDKYLEINLLGNVLTLICSIILAYYSLLTPLIYSILKVIPAIMLVYQERKIISASDLMEKYKIQKISYDDIKNILIYSTPFFIMTIEAYLNTSLDKLILSVVAKETIFAEYTFCALIASIVAIPQSYWDSRLMSKMNPNKINELIKRYVEYTKNSVTMVNILMCGILIGYYFITSLMLYQYKGLETYLILLMIAILIDTAFGSAGPVLTYMGYQKENVFYEGIVLILNSILSITLIILFKNPIIAVLIGTISTRTLINYFRYRAVCKKVFKLCPITLKGYFINISFSVVIFILSFTMNYFIKQRW